MVRCVSRSTIMASRPNRLASGPSGSRGGADGDSGDIGAAGRGVSVSCRSVLDGDAVFVPDDVPRRGVLALWGSGEGTGKVELVFTRVGGLRKRLVTAGFLSMAEALPELLSIDPNATGPNATGPNATGTGGQAV